MAAYEAKWPIRFVVDSRGASVGWAVVGARLASPSRQAQLAELQRAGFRWLGMMNDTTFPADTTDDPLSYADLCEAWCTCARDPSAYVPAGVPRVRLALSDFTDYQRVAPPASAARGYDLVYVSASEPWKAAAKGWPLARACLPRLCDELDLRALVVGAPPDAAALSPRVTAVAALPWGELLAAIAAARALFAPSADDASPRVLAEALCLDRPLLVNRAILGGWHYVNAFTGAFFTGPDDVADAARACFALAASPRAWFRANHGPYLAGRRLLALLRPLDPRITERSHLAISDRLDAPPTR